jgi:hypothetical protein
MSEWNLSSDQITLEQRQRRRSPVQWLRDNSIRIAVLVGLLAVFAYLWLRTRVPRSLKRPLWMVAMSQAVAGIVVPAIFGAFLIMAVIGGLLLVIMVLVMLGEFRRT